MLEPGTPSFDEWLDQTAEHMAENAKMFNAILEKHFALATDEITKQAKQDKRIDTMGIQSLHELYVNYLHLPITAKILADGRMDMLMNPLLRESVDKMINTFVYAKLAPRYLKMHGKTVDESPAGLPTDKASMREHLEIMMGVREIEVVPISAEELAELKRLIESGEMVCGQNCEDICPLAEKCKAEREAGRGVPNLKYIDDSGHLQNMTPGEEE